MSINREAYHQIIRELQKNNVTLVAVSKTKPVADILDLYKEGQKDFGENYVQEMVEKQQQLPDDIRWHFIGHLQSNKVKYIAPFVHLIQGVDSLKLLKEINRQGVKNNRVIEVLLQVHIATEETKFGLDENELDALFKMDQSFFSELSNIKVRGLMGMASFSNDPEQVRSEFRYLRELYNRYISLSLPNCSFDTLSMGMSSDYLSAIEEGSNMVRIGSLLFGEREKKI